jgi:hypothetical protein
MTAINKITILDSMWTILIYDISGKNMPRPGANVIKLFTDVIYEFL